MRGLTGSVVIVTGAGQGIGLEYARRLASEGCQVVIAELDSARGDAAADEIGESAVSIQTDVADPDSVDAMVTATIDRFDRVDGLVNNAAIYHGVRMAPLDDIDVDSWDQMMAVNVRGTFLCCRAVARHMAAQGHGSIVNVSSTVALVGPPLLPHYVASKGAVIALTRALATELGAHGIRVNAIAPGATWDEASMLLVGGDDSVADTFVQQQVIKKRQMPEHLTGTICFLLSDEAEMMTGQVVVVDAGSTFY